MEVLKTFWNKGCVTLCGLAIYIQEYLKTKRRIMETAKIYIIFKKIL